MIGGGKWGRRGREVGGKGREVGERGRELGKGYPPVHPLFIVRPKMFLFDLAQCLPMECGLQRRFQIIYDWSKK